MLTNSNRTPLLSVVILTLNEELHLPGCLNSVEGLDCDIFIIDSGSSDKTATIAREAGATVVTHAFINHAQQLNWALEHVPLSSPWVLRLDADERLTPELLKELKEVLPTMDLNVTGLFLKRRVHFMGRWIRHGGYYPTWILRVWRRGTAQSEQRAMDEHMVLGKGRPGFLKFDIWEENKKSLFEWIERQNRYTTREVQSLGQPMESQIKPALFGTPEARKRWLKYKLFLRSPLLLRAFMYFIWRYFFLLGFLDGTQGLIFHFLQGCWYRFLVDAKLYELKNQT